LGTIPPEVDITPPYRKSAETLRAGCTRAVIPKSAAYFAYPSSWEFGITRCKMRSTPRGPGGFCMESSPHLHDPPHRRLQLPRLNLRRIIHRNRGAACVFGHTPTLLAKAGTCCHFVAAREDSILLDGGIASRVGRAPARPIRESPSLPSWLYGSVEGIERPRGNAAPPGADRRRHLPPDCHQRRSPNS